MVPETLHESLTHLLMDNGSSVNKKSIDTLVHFIGVRDQSIVEGFIRSAERTLVTLQRETKEG